MLAALLHRVAASRALLASRVGGRRAWLVGPDLWLARGNAVRIGPALYGAVSFPGAVRVLGTGRLLATPETAACGLCGLPFAPSIVLAVAGSPLTLASAPASGPGERGDR